MHATDTAAFNITTPFGTVYSAWYDHYMAPGVFKVLETDLHGRFLERVGPGSRVLDVGCGGGQHAVHIAGRRPDVRVVGVDLSAELVRRARRLAAKAGVADRVEFVVGDALDLAFPDDQDFDHVYCAGSIKHWPDQRRGLDECLRVLRPGGRFLVMEADRSCRFSDVRSWARDTRTPRVLLTGSPRLLPHVHRGPVAGSGRCTRTVEFAAVGRRGRPAQDSGYTDSDHVRHQAIGVAQPQRESAGDQGDTEPHRRCGHIRR